MFVLSNIVSAIAYIIGGLLDVYFWVVIISALLSWVRPDPYNPIVRTLRTLTEPVYYRIRKLLPFTYTSGIDFSPIIVLICIELLNRVVVQSMLQFAMTL